VVHRLERDYDGQINFVYLDVDDPAAAAFKKELPFRGLPTLVLLNSEGEIVKEWVGLVKAEKMIPVFEEVLAE